MRDRDRLIGILAGFVGEHYKVALPRSVMTGAVTLILSGRHVDAIKELRNASPRGFTDAVVERVRHEADNPAVRWAVKNKAIPMHSIIGLKEARDIVVMLELVGGLK